MMMTGFMRRPGLRGHVQPGPQGQAQLAGVRGLVGIWGYLGSGVCSPRWKEARESRGGRGLKEGR
jgi:hypothetical protein